MLGTIRKLVLRALSERPAALGDQSYEASLKRASDAWRREMGAFLNEHDLLVMPDYPVLSADRLANCRVVPQRDDILAMMPAGAICAEVGVLAGEFSQAILETCRPAELHLIDLDLSTGRVADRFREEIAAGRVTLHESDSADTLKSFPDGHFDFIYIDGDHSYAGVVRDIDAAHPKVRSGGYLLFNDYTFWSSAECMPYGVVQAVNEFCIAHDWEIVAFALNYLGYADVALRRLQ